MSMNTFVSVIIVGNVCFYLFQILHILNMVKLVIP